MDDKRIHTPRRRKPNHVTPINQQSTNSNGFSSQDVSSHQRRKRDSSESESPIANTQERGEKRYRNVGTPLIHEEDRDSSVEEPKCSVIVDVEQSPSTQKGDGSRMSPRPSTPVKHVPKNESCGPQHVEAESYERSQLSDEIMTSLNSFFSRQFGTSTEGMYGENRVSRLKELTNVLQKHFCLDKESIILDVGSGRGIPNAIFSLHANIKASVGIELDRDTYFVSQDLLCHILWKNLLKWLPDSKSVPADIKDRVPMFNISYTCWDALAIQTLDPVTHIYSFDLAMPQFIAYRFSELFNNSSTAVVYVTFRKDWDILGLDAEHMYTVPMEMTGSGERHSCYVYVKRRFLSQLPLTAAVIGCRQWWGSLARSKGKGCSQGHGAEIEKNNKVKNSKVKSKKSKAKLISETKDLCDSDNSLPTSSPDIENSSCVANNEANMKIIKEGWQQFMDKIKSKTTLDDADICTISLNSCESCKKIWRVPSECVSRDGNSNPCLQKFINNKTDNSNRIAAVTPTRKLKQERLVDNAWSASTTKCEKKPSAISLINSSTLSENDIHENKYNSRRLNQSNKQTDLSLQTPTKTETVDKASPPPLETMLNNTLVVPRKRAKDYNVSHKSMDSKQLSFLVIPVNPDKQFWQQHIYPLLDFQKCYRPQEFDDDSAKQSVLEKTVQLAQLPLVTQLNFAHSDVLNWLWTKTRRNDPSQLQLRELRESRHSILKQSCRAYVAAVGIKKEQLKEDDLFCCCQKKGN